MVRRAYAQRSFFEVLLPDGDKLWDDELRTIDEVLEDDELVDIGPPLITMSRGSSPLQ